MVLLSANVISLIFYFWYFQLLFDFCYFGADPMYYMEEICKQYDFFSTNLIKNKILNEMKTDFNRSSLLNFPCIKNQCLRFRSLTICFNIHVVKFNKKRKDLVTTCKLDEGMTKVNQELLWKWNWELKHVDVESVFCRMLLWKMFLF